MNRHEYNTMKKSFLDSCWACQCSTRQGASPAWWGAPWHLQRAHIVNKPRRKDRRSVVLLCPLCHNSLDQRENYADDNRPRLTTNNAIWLKRLFDPEFYDLAFLKSNSVRQDLEPEVIPAFYLTTQLESVKRAAERADE